MKVYYDRDADLSALKGKKIAVIGFGSQGHAHALNLRDSGMDVCVGLGAKSASREKAAKQGLRGVRHRRGRQARRRDHDAGAGRDGRARFTKPKSRRISPRASTWPSVTASTSISNSSSRRPDVNVFMIAPKGPGHLVRSEYTKGRGVPCLLAVAAGSVGRHRQSRPRVRQRDRRRPRGDYRDFIQRGNRDRPVRRAIGAMRRTDRADSRRLRDAGRSRLRARDGVLRDACTK